MNLIAKNKVLKFVDEIGGIRELPPVDITPEVFLWGEGLKLAHYVYNLSKQHPVEYLYMTSTLVEEPYWHVLLHEITHATGHAKRLCRPTFRDPDGLDLYEDPWHQSYEELVANLGSLYLYREMDLPETIYFDYQIARIIRRCQEIKWERNTIEQAKNDAKAAMELILT